MVINKAIINKMVISEGWQMAGGERTWTLTGSWRAFLLLLLKKNKRKINTHMLPPPPQNLWEAFYWISKLERIVTPSVDETQRRARHAARESPKAAKGVVCQCVSKAFYPERLRLPARFEGRRTSPHPPPASSRASHQPLFSNPLEEQRAWWSHRTGTTRENSREQVHDSCTSPLCPPQVTHLGYRFLNSQPQPISSTEEFFHHPEGPRY